MYVFSLHYHTFFLWHTQAKDHLPTPCLSLSDHVRVTETVFKHLIEFSFTCVTSQCGGSQASHAQTINPVHIHWRECVKVRKREREPDRAGSLNSPRLIHIHTWKLWPTEAWQSELLPRAWWPISKKTFPAVTEAHVSHSTELTETC